MNNFIKKITASVIILAMFIYTLPIYAIKNEETIYSKLKNNGERYKTIVSTQTGEEIKETEIDKDLPINCDVEYELNGEKISADKLVGQSGNVKIILNYINKSERKVTVNGRLETMYTPFIVISGTIIDTTNNKNIKITNGKLIENGDNTIVVGIALPGLADSLKLPKNINNLNKIEISMETTNFEMENIITFCTPKVLDSDINWNEFNGIFDKIGSLENASNQIEDGIVDLKDGIIRLNSGAQDLKIGTEEYANQSQKFNQAINQVSGGINELSTNYNEINVGISSLNDNSKNLNTGIKTVGSGLQAIFTNLNAIDNTLGTFINSVNNLNTGASSLSNGLGGILTSFQGLTGTDNTEKITELQTLLDTNKTNIEELKQMNNLLDSQMISLTEGDLRTLLQNQKKLNNGNISCLEKNNQVLQESIIGLQNTDVTNINNLKIGLQNLSTGARDLTGGISQLENGLSSLKEGTNTLATNTNELAMGTTDLSQGADELSEGTETLAQGSSQVRDGLTNLNSSTEQLAEANKQLVGGAKTISGGIAELADGIKELSEGSIYLTDGVHQLNEEGIHKLCNYINVDLRNLVTRGKELECLSKDFVSFASEEKRDKINFVMMLDSIKMSAKEQKHEYFINNKENDLIKKNS